MGSLGYAPCIYDSFYPCSAGCDNKKCKYWYDEDAEECEEEENPDSDIYDCDFDI